MFTFSELQSEVKRGSVRDKSGTEFDIAIKNSINRAIYRLANEARWRSLRRESRFNTKTSYITGSGAVNVTNGSASVTITGATFVTDGVEINRRINIGGSSTPYRISAITGETTLTLDRVYDGTSSAVQTYSILPLGTYNLPIQSTHQAILWHEQYGAPLQLEYSTSQQMFAEGVEEDTTGTPYSYRMWGEDSVVNQPKTPGIISIISSSTLDTSNQITVFGTVSGYPDYEVLTINSTTTVNGTKSFSSVERVVANSTARVGRITATADSGNTIVAVLPVGNTTRELTYRKVSIRPLPDSVFPIFVYYYKTPAMLVNDGDVHELGSDFDSAIIFLATAIMRGETSQKEATTYLAMYKDELKVLRKAYLDKIDWLPKLSGGLMGNTAGMLHPYVSNGQIGHGGWFGERAR